jgi:hypothetical protein
LEKLIATGGSVTDGIAIHAHLEIGASVSITRMNLNVNESCGESVKNSDTYSLTIEYMGQKSMSDGAQSLHYSHCISAGSCA